MSYIEIHGNIFNSQAQALVNTVNCVGAMGKGIALEFRRRYPEMYQVYKTDCQEHRLQPGRIYSYPQLSGPLILNFAIKDNWKNPSRIEWIESCLKQFVAGYKNKALTSVAFPWMGAMNGGISLDQIQSIMRRYLRNLTDIEVEVYSFDPKSKDPLFERLERIASSEDLSDFKTQSNMNRKVFDVLINAVRNGEANSLAQLINLRLVGDTTIDKLYYFLTSVRFPDENEEIEKPNPGDEIQLRLF